MAGSILDNKHTIRNDGEVNIGKNYCIYIIKNPKTFNKYWLILLRSVLPTAIKCGKIKAIQKFKFKSLISPTIT